MSDGLIERVNVFGFGPKFLSVWLEMKMEISSLNVGCGLDSWGDVRVDLDCRFLDWCFKSTKLADANYLPFRDGAFKKAKSNHVRERLRCPSEALDELTRLQKKSLSCVFRLKGYFGSGHFTNLSISQLLIT